MKGMEGSDVTESSFDSYPKYVSQSLHHISHYWKCQLEFGQICGCLLTHALALSLWGYIYTVVCLDDKKKKLLTVPMTMCKTDSKSSQKAQAFYGQHMCYTRILTFSIFTTQYHCVRIIMPCSLGDYKTTPCLVITIQPCKLNLNGKYMQILTINLGQQLLQHRKHPDPGDCRYASSIFHSEW